MGCEVKLVRMLRPARATENMSFRSVFSTYEEGAEFVALTDRDGRYRFESIPVGEYKLKWLLPGDTGWIRRLKLEPDATIQQGRTAPLKPVEMNRSLARR